MKFVVGCDLEEFKEYYKRNGYAELVPREAAVEVSIAGTAQDCIEKIAEFVKAGVEHFILLDVGADPRKLGELYSKEIKPRFAQ